MRTVFLFFDTQNVVGHHLAWALAADGEVLAACSTVAHERQVAADKLRSWLTVGGIDFKTEWIDNPATDERVVVALAANYLRWAA